MLCYIANITLRHENNAVVEQKKPGHACVLLSVKEEAAATTLNTYI